MIWNDKIGDILTLINAGSVYNTNRSTTPSDFQYAIFNQAQDWLCMYKAWRDLRVDVAIVPDVNRQITLPADFGCCIFVYTDPSGIGKPMYFYTLNDNDIARRYTEIVTRDGTTGAYTRKFAFGATTPVLGNPHVVYSKILDNVTVADIAKISFFPMTIMLIVAKKILQDFYGVPANQDPNWINQRVQEEIRMLEGYAYNNNVALDMSVHDRFGNPVFITGTSLDGSKPRMNRPSPFLPSTMFTGGTG
jgi:hypothetical protein